MRFSFSRGTYKSEVACFCLAIEYFNQILAPRRTGAPSYPPTLWRRTGRSQAHQALGDHLAQGSRAIHGRGPAQPLCNQNEYSQKPTAFQPPTNAACHLMDCPSLAYCRRPWMQYRVHGKFETVLVWILGMSLVRCQNLPGFHSSV